MKLSRFGLFAACVTIVSSAGGAPAEAPGPGDHVYALSVGGLARRYTLHVPRGHDGKRALPLVVMLHGGGGTGRGAAWETGWSAKADEAGFLVAYPEALARDPSRRGSFARNPQCWNDGSGRFQWSGRTPDDVAFLHAVLDDAAAKHTVAPRRVFVTGFSNGASMAFRFGAEASARVAVVAPVAGACWLRTLTLERSVPMLYLTGTADPLNPLEGGAPRLPTANEAIRNTPKPPVRDSVLKWVRAAGCPEAPASATEADGVRTEAYGPGRDGAEVVFVTVEGLGHTWAGGKSLLPERLVGKRSDKIKATDVIWAFFEKHAAAETPASRSGGGFGSGAPDVTGREWVTPAVRAPRLQHRTFGSAAAKSRVSYHVYTPDEYDAEGERRFPVLYWLHGSGGGLAGLPHLVRHFDGAIRAGKTPPMLVVFPNGLPHSLWCDSKDGGLPMETIVVKELVPHIDATFRTIAAREGRLVEGFSMGGYGAARLGFKHHDLFGAVSLLGAGPLQREFTETPRVGPRGREAILQAVFGGDHEYFRAQSPWVLAERNAAAVRAGTRVRQAIGERDETLGFNRQFHEHLERLGIAHSFTVAPGLGHNPMALLNALGEANWEFYRAAFGDGAGQPR